ncbi:hypothetical protein HB820_11965 [Listeria booriae]|uniref:SRPBCC domain-containing protein n=1 Tax=Listeria booriae TaxID=1552123 RepID=UPI00162397CA|nr:SRPBCC domain-containing protein [Listeria booriae]MBC1336019.1 hypothetical protein [Listeria booriae]MBC6163233.1 hypothetical protein [Listeria booriae]
MQETYNKKTDKTGDMIFEIELKGNIETVWNLIATTKGFEQWFPEISVGEPGVNGLILFDFGDGQYEESTITAYESPTLLQYDWDKNTVRFELTDQGDTTTLTFTESIVNLTTHTPRDIAGWHMCLQRIQGILESREVSFTEDEFLALFDKYQALLFEK